jgi:hypothetical protein
MKIAILILAHKNPHQVARFIKKLQHPQIDCYLHIDAKVDITDWDQELVNLKYFKINNRINIGWASWSMVEATRVSIQQVIDTKIDYKYLTLASGQDYIIKPISEYLDFLSNSDKEYIGVIEDAQLKLVTTKFEQYHFMNCNFKGKYAIQHIINKILPKRYPPLHLEVKSGSQWWTLSFNAVKYVLNYLEEHKKVERYFKFIWGPDEFVFQTILWNSPFKDKIAGHDLHYIDWSAGKEHPKDLDIFDLQAILDSKLFFARKFDLTRAESLLQAIDNQLE